IKPEKIAWGDQKWTERTPAQRLKAFSPKKEGGEGLSGILYLEEILRSNLVRSVKSNYSIKMIMDDFWLDHFTVNLSKGDEKFVFHRYVDIIQKYSFARFDELLIAIYQTPNMMHYLDNRDNRVGNHNENFAREIFEIHTVGSEGGYTDQDIKKLSYILSGWTCNKEKFFFKSEYHAGQSEPVFGISMEGEGFTLGQNFLKKLALHEKTGEYLSRKLIRSFLGEEVPEKLLRKMVKTYVDNKSSLKELYLSLFLSEEFRSLSEAKIQKSPLLLTKTLLKVSEAKIKNCAKIFEENKRLGQRLYHCPIPYGYYPYRERWLSSGQIIDRSQFVIDVVENRCQGIEVSEVKRKSIFSSLLTSEFHYV
ncbi:MAG: DUF1800 family protein, partial [Bdellovibrionales bacterium]|nr:DUF1800 domain-containing protein [Bdellovibrionales bacterium]NQZ18409.1 DUF1800 family protein [Bdellovibrionales bacterium]